jgi:hypothetical protein
MLKWLQRCCYGGGPSGTARPERQRCAIASLPFGEKNRRPVPALRSYERPSERRFCSATTPPFKLGDRMGPFRLMLPLSDDPGHLGGRGWAPDGRCRWGLLRVSSRTFAPAQAFWRPKDKAMFDIRSESPFREGQMWSMIPKGDIHTIVVRLGVALTIGSSVLAMLLMVHL